MSDIPRASLLWFALHKPSETQLLSLEETLNGHNMSLRFALDKDVVYPPEDDKIEKLFKSLVKDYLPTTPEKPVMVSGVMPNHVARLWEKFCDKHNLIFALPKSIKRGHGFVHHSWTVIMPSQKEVL